MTARLPLVLLGCVLLAVCRSSRGAGPEEWDRELPAGVRFDPWGDEPGFWVPMRVIDDRTGQPIAGARIDNWWEADRPGAEPWEDCLVQSRVTDCDGIALVEKGEYWSSWFYVEAPGYAPLGEMGWEQEWRLRRGEDVTVEIRDWRERPVPDARLGYHLGCGHTPNVREKRTDSAGRATFRCVDADEGFLWVRAEGVAGASYAYHNGFPPGEGVRVIRCDPAPTVRGVVLRADGTPAVGAYVGTRAWKRGPWTTTCADGRFRLLGAPAFDTLEVCAPPVLGSPKGTEWTKACLQTVPGVVQTVRLPPPSQKDGGTADDLPQLRVVIRPEGDAAPEGKIRVVVVRDSDGAACVAHPEFGPRGEAVAEFEVPSGIWRVIAGTPAGALRLESRSVVVAEDGAEFALELKPNPVVRPVLLERGSDGSVRPVEVKDLSWFRIVTAEGVESATPAVGGGIHVPRYGPFVLRHATHRARVRFDGGWEDRISPTLVVAAVEPAGPEEDDAPSFPASRLTVLLPDGSPARGARIRVPVADGYLSTRVGNDGTFDLAPERGAELEVSAPDFGRIPEHSDLPDFEIVLDRPGPWTVRWPDTKVTVRAVDPAGRPLDLVTVRLPGQYDTTINGSDGVAVIPGRPPGILRFWVETQGYRTHDLRLVLVPGERREVRVVMALVNPR